jgi:DNA repair protein RadA/Sms
MGKCPQCHEWNTLELESKALTLKTTNNNPPQKILDIALESFPRVQSGLREFDRVVGGGFVHGSLTLLGGNPGVGKSTLLLEVCRVIAKDHLILYASGEESCSQIASRCQRIGLRDKNLLVLHETVLDDIKSHCQKIKPKVLIIDSVQTMTMLGVQATPGSPTQIKETTYELMNMSKSLGLICLVIGHVTKEGALAGPKLLEHMVDCVLSFEMMDQDQYRLLRTFKNRFGSTHEVGLFEMNEKGLTENLNPEKIILEDISMESFGRGVSCVYQGSRVTLVEIQALVVESESVNSKRVSHGYDSNRLVMLIAIFEKYLNIPLNTKDIYINVVGGVKQDCKEIDLCLLATLLSSLYQKPLPKDSLFLGEVGLTGEVRSPKNYSFIEKELNCLGFNKIVCHKEVDERVINCSECGELKNIIKKEL